MKIEQLLSTGILDSLRKTTSCGKNDISSSALISSASVIITSFFKILKDFDNFQDPAREYLKKLRNDYAVLSKTKTHASQIKPLLNLIKIELEAGNKYMDLYRKKPHNKILMDFFLIVLYDILKELSYRKRLEIIADTYLLFYQTPDKYRGWKSKNPNAWKIKHLTIKRRIDRASKRFHAILNSPQAKQYKSLRLEWFKKQTKKEKLTAIGNDPYWATKRGIKRGIRSILLQKAFADEVKKQLDNFNMIDASKLLSVMKKLKIPTPNKNLNLLLADTEFLNVFKLPQHKK